MKGSYWIINTEYGAFLTDKNDFIGMQLEQSLVWEPEIVEIYNSILQPHYVVLDIGTHMGFHTVNFANLSNHVYAFEPQLRLYNQLRGNIFLNELNEKVTCFNVGLGEKDKRSSFGSLFKHNSLNWDGNSGVEVINYGGRSLEDDLGTNEIEIKTLDSFNLSPDFIKIDVEGYELKTLQGSLQTLTKHTPIILFESFPEIQDQVINFLESLNYEIYPISTNSDFIAIHPNFKDYQTIKSQLNK